MIRYVVHTPMPLGVPVSLGAEAVVTVRDLDANGVGRLSVVAEDPRFAQQVRACLARCYGFRGRPIGERLSIDDLHCAMASRAMQRMKPHLQASRE